MKDHLRERVFSRLIIEPETGCLLWTGGLDAEGYGRVWDSRTKKQSRIHRLMWEIANGPIPDDVVIDHVKERGCRNRHCGNVAHLELVTQAENRHRAKKTHCKYGHEYTPENTYWFGIRRTCRICIKRRHDARKAARADGVGWGTE